MGDALGPDGERSSGAFKLGLVSTDTISCLVSLGLHRHFTTFQLLTAISGFSIFWCRPPFLIIQLMVSRTIYHLPSLGLGRHFTILQLLVSTTIFTSDSSWSRPPFYYPPALAFFLFLGWSWQSLLFMTALDTTSAHTSRRRESANEKDRKA